MRRAESARRIMILKGSEIIQMVAECHKAVGQMYVFNRNIRVIRRNVVVREIPKAFYTEFDQFLCDFGCAFTRNTQYRNSWDIFTE